MHMDMALLDWWSPARDGGYYSSPAPAQRQGRRRVPRRAVIRTCIWETASIHQGSLWESLEVWVIWMTDGWSGSWTTQIWSWLFSYHVSFIHKHPIRMNSALHKKYRGKKYWFYTIHFLKYIQSKISYVFIMSYSQSALMCNHMLLCECIPEYPIYNHTVQSL